MRRALVPIAMMLAAPAAAQSGIGYDQGGPYQGIFADHDANANNGAVRLNRRMGGDGAHSMATAPATPKPTQQPATSGIHVYHPTPLNDLAIAEKEKMAARRQAKAPR